MAYNLWYQYYDSNKKEIKKIYKSFMYYVHAKNFKSMIEIYLKNLLPIQSHYITFYIQEESDPIYEIWWQYENGDEDLSDCGIFTDVESLYHIIQKEQIFWDKLYKDDQIEEYIKVIPKTYYFDNMYQKVDMALELEGTFDFSLILEKN